MQNMIMHLSEPQNEPLKSYASGGPERELLKKELTHLSNQQFDIPLIINGKEIRTGDTGNIIEPYDHQNLLGIYHKARDKEINKAILASQ